MAFPTVLVVDDDDAIRETVAEILRDDGYRVLTANDGAEGLDLVRREPGVLILDLMMPVMTGWQVLNKLRAEPGLRQRTPVIVLSAAGEQALRRLPADVVTLQKPFDVTQLLREVARLGSQLGPS